MPHPAPADLTSSILAWYSAHRRTLPWRTDPSPYHVLLSELMLQQTRVETVIPYFERFIARWPTLEDLAQADETDVLQAWSGLGYYRRARNLLRCAREATSQGGLPDSVDALRELPGIGPYTAGAIASIAFGVRAPLVDGNVERVISRVDARTEPPKTQGKKAMWSRVQALHDAAPADSHPGDLNQALMELGATVCTPRSPRCEPCPWHAPCQARAQGKVDAIPVKAPKAKPKELTGVAGLLWTDGWIMGCRPEGLLGGLWEPIAMECGADASVEQAVVRAFADRAGLDVTVGAHLGSVVHVFTHRRLTVQVFRVEGAGAPQAKDFYTDVRSVTEPEEVPLSALARKILALADTKEDQLALPLAAERR